MTSAAGDHSGQSGNAELVQRMTDAWNRRDLNAILSRAAHDVIYTNHPTAVEPGTRMGHEAFADVLRKQWEALGPQGRQEIDEIHSRREEVFVVGRLSMTMPGSDTRLETRFVLRWRIRDRLIAGCEVLGAGPTFSEGLRAAGLSEPNPR